MLSIKGASFFFFYFIDLIPCLHQQENKDKIKRELITNRVLLGIKKKKNKNKIKIEIRIKIKIKNKINLI